MMSVLRVSLVVVLCVSVTVMAVGEYEPPPPVNNERRTQFDISPPLQEDAMQGTRDEARDPSKWIMNLAITKNPPWKRYRRPTTAAPQALAQQGAETSEDDSMELSVKPE